MDRLISEKMQMGMADEDIINEILGGGGSDEVKTNKDLFRMEE